MKEFFDFVLENIVFTWFGAIFLIVFGIIRVRKTIKDMMWDSHWLSYSVFGNGIIFSIGCIILGIVVIYQKIVK